MKTNYCKIDSYPIISLAPIEVYKGESSIINFEYESLSGDILNWSGDDVVKFSSYKSATPSVIVEEYGMYNVDVGINNSSDGYQANTSATILSKIRGEALSYQMMEIAKIGNYSNNPALYIDQQNAKKATDFVIGLMASGAVIYENDINEELEVSIFLMAKLESPQSSGTFVRDIVI